MISSMLQSRLIGFSGSSGICVRLPSARRAFSSVASGPIYATRVLYTTYTTHANGKDAAVRIVLAGDMDTRKVRTNIYLDPELVARLDEVRKGEPGFPSRAEVIRMLLWEALAARAKKSK